jgi:hypothetical protein
MSDGKHDREKLRERGRDRLSRKKIHSKHYQIINPLKKFATPKFAQS